MTSTALKLGAIQVYVREVWNSVEELQVLQRSKHHLYEQETRIFEMVGRSLGDSSLLADARQSLADTERALLLGAPFLLAAVHLLVDALQWTVQARQHEARGNFALMCNKADICLHRTTILRLQLVAGLERDAEQVRLRGIVDSQLKNVCVDAKWTTRFIEPELTPRPANLQKAEQRLSGGDRSANLRACATWWRINWALTHIVEVAYICDSYDLASHYAGAQKTSESAGTSYASAEMSLSRAETTLYPSIKRLFLACGAAYTVNAEENVALYFSRTSTEPEQAAGVSNSSVRCAEVFANTLEKRLQWRDGLLAALPFVSDHGRALLAMVEAGASRYEGAVEVIVNVLDSLGDVSTAHQSLVFRSRLLPGAEIFRLAQHYTDQHVAAFKLQHESEYHGKAAEYWGACTGITAFLAGAADFNAAAEGDDDHDVLSAAQEHLDSAVNFARCATGVLQDAINCRFQAERARATRNEGSFDEDVSALLDDVVQAWTTAARGFMAAATDCCIEEDGYVYYDYYLEVNRQRYPNGAEQERSALQSVQDAEQLQRKVVSLAPPQAGCSIQMLLERHCVLQEAATDKPGASSAVKSQHCKCLELLQQFCESEEYSLAHYFNWVGERMVAYSRMLLQMAKNNRGGAVHPAFDRLYEVLLGFAQSCEEYDGDDSTIPVNAADKLQLQALLDAVAAQLQGNGGRCDILLYAAELVDLSYDTFPASEEALVFIAKRLVQSTAGGDVAEELQAPSHFTSAAVLDIDTMVEAVVQRAEAAEAARMLSKSAESRTYYALAYGSLAELIGHLHSLLDKRLCGKEDSSLEKEVVVARRSAETYLLAARALEQG
jgi:hypothetical protein